MRKHIIPRVVFLAATAVLACFAISSARADSSSPWIDDDLNLQKQAETKSIPTSLNGNIDCAQEDNFNCSVSTVYGAATQNSTVRLNGTPNFLPIFSYIDNRQHFIPVPNSNEFITYTADPVYGFYLSFNYNLSGHITHQNGGLGSYYQVVSPPDGKLADKAGNRLAADYDSMGFSENGQWMVVSEPNVAMLRVNLQTFEVIPFAQGFNYTIGLDPNIKTAISNDGRYAVVESKEFDRYEVYDLDTCPALPDVVNGPVACQHRDLGQFMKQSQPDYSFTSYVRFLDDDVLSAYSTSTVASTNHTYRYIISPDKISDQFQYLALGDSYISGEGAFDYLGGTDEPDNECHLSAISYPFLLGRDLDYDSYHSVACSGAVMSDVLDASLNYRGQADDKKIIRQHRTKDFIDNVLESFKPGYVDQLDFVSRYQPQVITISISGNDVGMIGKLKSCISPGTCFANYEDRLEVVNDINNAFPKLVDTYRKLEAAGPPGMRIYAIAYPQVAKPGGDCAENVHLNDDEVTFTAEAIDYLDSMIKAAAAKAGVYYVDTENALAGHRLCEAGPGSVAMNGITAGNDVPKRLDGPIGSESFHPNAFGHQLIESKVLSETDNLTAPMPNADSSASIPSPDGSGILNAPKNGRTVSNTEYDPGITDDLAYSQVPLDVSISGAEHALPANVQLTAELHSTPTSLGSFTTDAQGNLSAQVMIPAGVAPRFHTLHFYGTDITGQPIDIYKDIYLAANTDDMDGNSVLDDQQKCVGVDPVGIDYDQDGIDDSCDGEIGQPPAGLGQPAVLSASISSATPDLLAFTSAGGEPGGSISSVSFTARSKSDAPASPKPVSVSESNLQQPQPDSLRLSGKDMLLGLFVLLAGGLALSLI